MPSTCIWIITPGALGKSGVPAQMEERKVSLTEIVYEQSDLVIFDEADTVQEWFDNLFAEEVVLTNGSSGLLDKEDVETARSLVPQRTLRPHTRRWVEAERHSLISISNILSNLTDRQHGPLLSRWIERNYFTALTLAYKLLWRLLDFPKWEECQGQERKEAMDRIKPLIAYFVKLNEKDPLKMKRPPTGAPEQSYRLALIMRSLLAAGDSTHNELVEEEGKSWILDYIPNIKQTLQKLEKELEEQKRQPSHKSKDGKVEAPDTLETFALRLEFVLNVMILDRNIRIVFYEWYEKPDMMSTDLNETSLQGSPDNVKDILPIPPTGRVFGTYYSKDLETGQADTLPRTRASGLSVFGYSNIGRWYMMNFHKLFSELDGKPGPNVLSLSGTSWLPNSSRWHLDMSPQGILEPPQEAREAIKQSVFSFIPQYKLVEQSRLKRRMRKQKSLGNKTNKPEKVLEPIFISGESEKMQPIKDLVRALASGQHKKQSFLREELECLQEKGRSEPNYWADRERLLLLVNSYEQARWAYQALVFSEAYPGEICYLTQGKEDRDEVVSSAEAEVYRSDIEDFAKKTRGRMMTQLLQRVQALEERLGKDSHNSHLPPSSDRFVRQPKSLRKPSGKKPGGQPGHPGQSLRFSSSPDEVIVQRVECCQHCQADLQEVLGRCCERRQVVDVPLPRMVVREYLSEQKQCPHCQQISFAPFPVGVQAPVQYGTHVGAMAVYLVQRQLLPLARVCEVLDDLVGIRRRTSKLGQ